MSCDVASERPQVSDLTAALVNRERVGLRVRTHQSDDEHVGRAPIHDRGRPYMTLGATPRFRHPSSYLKFQLVSRRSVIRDHVDNGRFSSSALLENARESSPRVHPTRGRFLVEVGHDRRRNAGSTPLPPKNTPFHGRIFIRSYRDLRYSPLNLHGSKKRQFFASMRALQASHLRRHFTRG